MLKISAVAALILFAFSTRLPAQYLLSPVNLGFEQTRVGERPFGWDLQPDKGWYFLAGAQNPAAGRMCGELGKTNTFQTDSIGYAAASMTLDATPYRGRSFKARAAVRSSTGDTADSFFYVTLTMPRSYKGDADVMAVVKVASTDWQMAEADLEIPAEAESVSFGIATNERAVVWIDEISIVAPEPDVQPTPASRLTDKELERLAAFAKVYGDLRYFHPTSEALAADWESLALRGVRSVVSAGDGEAFIDTLQSVFAPVAPSAKFARARMKAEPNEVAPADALKNLAIAYVHNGIGTSNPSELVNSDTVNVFESQRKREAAAIQNIDAKPLRGKKVRFSALANSDAAQPGSHSEIWMRCDREEGRVAFMLRQENKPDKSGKPERIFLEGDIPEDATILRLGLVFIGEGKGKFDDARLELVDGKSLISIEISNPGFEEGERSELSRGWVVPGTVREAGYAPKLAKSDMGTEGNMLTFESDTSGRIRLPEPGERYSERVSGDYELSFPLTLYADSAGTLPHATKPLPAGGAIYHMSDRNSRLAISILAWNILRHFNVTGLRDKELNAALTAALRSAAESDSEREFLETLRRLVAYFGDAESRVWSSSLSIEFLPPFDWTLEKGKIIITSASKESGLTAGDEVTEIDGKASADVLKDYSARFAGSKNWNLTRALFLVRSGVEGSEIQVKAKSDKGTKSVALKRTYVPADFGLARPESFSDIGGGIYYVDMTVGTDAELKKFAPRLVGAKGVIFDARGSTSMSEHFLGYFTDSTMASVSWKMPIFTRPGGPGSYNTIKASINPLKALKETPRVFLASERSLGYSEAILWLARERSIAKIIGSETAGGMGDVFATRLPGGLFFTTSVVQGYSDRGESLFGRPVRPDVAVETSAKDLIEGRDEAIERAKDFLLNGK